MQNPSQGAPGIGSGAHWYEDFFHGVALDMWRRAITPQITDREVDFLVDVLDLPAGARILDVPCGNGRHSIALGRRGYRLTGIDLASEFIAEARAAADAQNCQTGSPIHTEFFERDMRELPWESEFDAAICLGNSFTYLDHAGTIDLVNAVSRALKPHARFVIDTGCAAESVLPNLQERAWMELGDLLFLSSRKYDARESRLEIDYTFVRGGTSETRHASCAVYTVAEIRRMLKAAGFTIKSAYGGFDKSVYQFGSPRLILIAQKI